MNSKSKNLLIYFTKVVVGALIAGYVLFSTLGINDPLQIIGVVAIGAVGWRLALAFYRRRILPSREPKSYGKWAIVTGSTSGLGNEFSDHLAEKGMNILLIARTEAKLKKQQQEISHKYGVLTDHLIFDFSATGKERADFYRVCDEKCAELDKKGGIGLLVNNVSTYSDIPMNLDEHQYMKKRQSGGIISVSSGAGNHPTPMLAVYSATKAFMTQFSRSMHVECWGTGVDFLVITPYYILSHAQTKRGAGTLIAPQPIKLVKGALSQLGKQYIWQGHGYWFHGFLGNFAAVYWGTTARWRKMMKDNRRRYDERLACASAARSAGTRGRDQGQGDEQLGLGLERLDSNNSETSESLS